MKTRHFITLILVFSYSYYYTQVRVQPEIGVSGAIAAFGWYNGNKVHDFSPSEGDNKGYKSGNGYIGFNLKMGTTFHNKNKSFNVSVLYQFLQSRDGRAVMTERSVLYSNLIGLSGGVRFFENKKIRLVAVINMYSEFATNYKDQLLLQKQYTPANIADPNIYIDTDSYNIYKGTPLVGDILVGGNLKISKNFGLNLLVGYGIRLLKSQEVVKSIVGVYPNKINVIQPINSPYNIIFHMLDVQLGLNYTFSFKKKEK